MRILWRATAGFLAKIIPTRFVLSIILSKISVQ